MITESLLKSISDGREGKNKGFSMGLPKLESVIDGVCANTYYLVFSPSGTGKNNCRLHKELCRLLQTKIGKF